jgi:single-stranded-DNA-specific exonuclease
VPGFNLYEAVHACKEHLIGYGGHFAAAGMTIRLDQIEAFKNKFEEVVATSIPPELLMPEIVVDAEIRFRDITWPFYNIITQMEPFGPENLRPHFLVRNVSDSGFSKILKEAHLRVVLRQDNITLTGIGFGMAEKLPILQKNKPVDIVFKIDENEWNGEKILQLKMIDVRLSDTSAGQYE